MAYTKVTWINEKDTENLRFLISVNTEIHIEWIYVLSKWLWLSSLTMITSKLWDVTIHRKDWTNHEDTTPNDQQWLASAPGQSLRGERGFIQADRPELFNEQQCWTPSWSDRSGTGFTTGFKTWFSAYPPPWPLCPQQCPHPTALYIHPSSHIVPNPPCSLHSPPRAGTRLPQEGSASFPSRELYLAQSLSFGWNIPLQHEQVKKKKYQLSYWDQTDLQEWVGPDLMEGATKRFQSELSQVSGLNFPFCIHLCACSALYWWYKKEFTQGCTSPSYLVAIYTRRTPSGFTGSILRLQMSQDKINPVAVAVSSACSSGVCVYLLRDTHTISNYTYSHFSLNHQAQDTWTWPSTLCPFLVPFPNPREQLQPPGIWSMDVFSNLNHAGVDCSLHHTSGHKAQLLNPLSIVVSTTPGQESPLCSLDTQQDVCDSARGHIWCLGSC